MPKLALAIFLLLIAALAGWNSYAHSWEGWAPATCRPDHCFCEAIGDGTVVQPANAWSSLAFALAGLLIAYAPAGQNPIALAPAWRRLYGSALVAIGLGSYFYHASLSFAGQVCDMSGMYLLITFALLHGVAQRRRISASGAIGCYIVLNLSLLGFQAEFPDLRRYVFAGLVVGVAAMEASARATVQRTWLWRAMGMLGVAFAIWVLDITKVVCAPASPIQGHAMWHILGAMAAWCLYRYYQKEALPV